MIEHETNQNENKETAVENNKKYIAEKMRKNSIYGVFGTSSEIKHIGHTVSLDLNCTFVKYKYSPLMENELVGSYCCIKYNKNSMIVACSELSEEYVKNIVRYIKKNISKSLIQKYYAIAVAIKNILSMRSNTYGNLNEVIKYHSNFIIKSIHKIIPLIENYTKTISTLSRKTVKRFSIQFISGISRAGIDALICAAIVFECDDFMRSSIREINGSNMFPYEELLSYVIYQKFAGLNERDINEFISKYLFDQFDGSFELPRYEYIDMPCNESSEGMFGGDILNVVKIPE